MESEKYLGYVKYEGELVRDGLMGARKQGEVLISLDSAIRNLLEKQAPGLSSVDYEIPVRIKKGSWEALVPETAIGWLQAGAGVVATAYATKAAQKMAERDFEDFGIRDVVKKSLSALKWLVRLGKHMGTTSFETFPDADLGRHGEVGVRNDAGDVLYIPKSIFDICVKADPYLLNTLASNVEKGRCLKLETYEGFGVDEEELDFEEKSLFLYKSEKLEEYDEVLFPSLRHGDEVALIGEITRENKTSNSMGFKYQDHILTAYPSQGSIVNYKRFIFSTCKLFGYVSRQDENGGFKARRPKLVFYRLEILHDGNLDLFS